jgi:PAS domain S-box-containing protein
MSFTIITPVFAGINTIHGTLDAGPGMMLIKAINPALIISLAALVVISIVTLVLYLKLVRANKELKERNNQVEEINNNLEKSNRELSAQKELITREYSNAGKFYQNMLEAADDGISFYDRDWNLKFANTAFYSIIGHNRDSYLRTDFADIFHPDDLGYNERRQKALADSGYFESELRLLNTNGQYITLSTRSVDVKDDAGESLGSLTISRDMTKTSQVHDALIKANKDAENSNRLKSSFLANISHEIRTPLNSVVGFSNLLLTNNLTQKTREEYIDHINYNSEKLLQIIGDIIDLSRLESSQIQITYEETSVNEVVTEVIEESRKAIRRYEKPITLNVRNNYENNIDLIFTDRVWLKRVLSHLLDNAVKFTLDGSVEFSFYREDESIFFRVKDTGIGINKENLTRIFEGFNQEINGHHRPFEGLGIGLTLAKEVVERMGGKIFVESEKGLGSEFSFSIPYRPAGSTKAKIRSISDDQTTFLVNWSSFKCLIVDDNKDVLIYLNKLLTDTGITVISVRSGKEAVEIVKSRPDLDIILLDMQMPVMNGIEATKEIRKIRKDIPIIAQTAFVFEDDKDIVIEAGCDACLIKPIRRDNLITVMSSFLKSI